jgi:hypothetical protein
MFIMVVIFPAGIVVVRTLRSRFFHRACQNTMMPHPIDTTLFLAAPFAPGYDEIYVRCRGNDDRVYSNGD